MRWLGWPAISSPSKRIEPRDGPMHPGDGADQRGLARAVGADDGDDLALGDLERDAVERLRVAVEEVEIADGQHHGRAAAARAPPR